MDIEAGTFSIDEGMEDVHSQVEYLLMQKLGDVGKKIHAGRSRNDQVLVDLKLFMRAKIEEINEAGGVDNAGVQPNTPPGVSACSTGGAAAAAPKASPTPIKKTANPNKR